MMGKEVCGSGVGGAEFHTHTHTHTFRTSPRLHCAREDVVYVTVTW
jgi:hypothetical protein